MDEYQYRYLEDKCKYIEKDLAEHKESNSKSHERIYLRLAGTENFVATATAQLSSIVSAINDIKESSKESTDETKESFKELKGTVSALAEKPAKRWDGMIGTIIAVVVTAITMFIVDKITKGG